MKSKPCKKCGDDKPLSQYGRNSKSSDGHMHICRDCRRYNRSQRRFVQKSPIFSEVGVIRIRMRHGHSSACLYQRLLNNGHSPDTARMLAESAFSNNDKYGRLRRKLGVAFRL